MGEYWFTQTWSARRRDDGTLEPDAPISGVGIGPKRDEFSTPDFARRMLEQFGKIKPSEPFFTLEAKFALHE
jgi:hypothetical protein